MDPTITMLDRIIAAAGRRLELVTAEPVASPALADLSDAWRKTAAGPMVDWTRIRGLLDWITGDAEKTAIAIQTPPPRSGLPMLDALLAGIAEKLADDADLERPRWAASVPPLQEPWLPPGTPRMIAAARAATPPQLAARGICIAAHDLWRTHA